MSVTKPQEDGAEGSAHYLRLAATALTLTAGAIGLAAQILEHFRKPKAGPNQRTKAGTALLALSVLRALPSLIKSARTLASDLGGSTKS